jgi:cell division protein FtsI (penicillin-binding protein 3)
MPYFYLKKFYFLYEPIKKLLKNISINISKDRSFSNTEIDINRILVLIISFALCYGIIALRVFDLTILSSIEHIKKVPVEIHAHSKRAEIIDRHGNLLAVNLITSSIYANPKIILNSKDAAQKIKSVMQDLNLEELEKKLSSKKSFVWIKRNITPKEHQLVNDLGIPGLYFETSEKRAYPNGELFAHVLGYVGLDGNGLAGVEKQYDSYLKYDVDNHPKPLQLSLDVGVQNIVRDELLKTIKEFNAKGAVGIVQDTRTGEILAMVSLPDFNPHNPGIATDEQLFNKCTLGTYEMGSMFKAFTMAMALESKSTSLSDVYDVSSAIKYAKFNINDYRGKGGWLSVPEILMYSSNIGTAQVALELGKENQYKFLNSFGLLSPLGIELPEKAKPIFPKITNWSDLNTITISYGHGISVSPMHVVGVMSSIVNGGMLHSTTIIKQQNLEQISSRQVLKESTSEKMRKLLRLVVTNGSGKKADVKGLFPGGKTATANKIVNGKYHDKLRLSSFLSAFPINEPKYTILVMIDEPKGTKETFGFATGGWTSAPTTSRIIMRLANLYGIMPYDNKDEIDSQLYLEHSTKNDSL